MKFKTIKVCGHEVKFSMEPCGEDRGLFTWEKGNMLIKVDPNLSDSMTADTALHELLHALYYLVPIMKKDGEERTVTALATHLTTTFAENPEFTKWYLNLLK